MEIKEQLQRILEDVPKVYEAGKSSISQEVSNALKGSEMGEVVALKDVSPVEHNLGVKVESKNLFDVSKVKTGGNVVNNGDGTITVKKEGGNPCGSTFGELCPDLKVGDVFTLSLRVTNAVEDTKEGTFIYLVGLGTSVKSGTTLTTTQAMLNSNVYLYTSTSLNQGNVTEGIVSEIQVELGTTATPYTPYLANPEAVKITTKGENLFNVYAITKTSPDGGYREGDTLFNPIGVWGRGSHFEGFSMYLQKGYYHITADVFTSSPETSTTTIRFYNPEIDKYSENVSYTAITTGVWHHLRWRPKIEYDGWYFISAVGGGNASNHNNLDIRFKNIMITKEEVYDYYPPFEPYVEPIEYAYGDEIKSISPSTTLMTDTEGAVLTVEYNKDINNAFAELQKAIISLGGNV